MSSKRLAALLIASVLGLAGCAPSCSALCQKLDRCALNGDVSTPECIASCDKELQDAGTDTDGKDGVDDKATLEAFNAHRRCLGSHSCEEIGDGACYDEALFAF